MSLPLGIYSIDTCAAVCVLMKKMGEIGESFDLGFDPRQRSFAQCITLVINAFYLTSC